MGRVGEGEYHKLNWMRLSFKNLKQFSSKFTQIKTREYSKNSQKCNIKISQIISLQQHKNNS